MKKLIYLLCALILLSIPIIPQKATAAIYGKVIFSDGSAISGVAVELTGDVIGKKTIVTSEKGNFRFLFLPPGNYELKFELEGFQTMIRKGIRLYMGKSITLSIRMETATIKKEIVITRKAVAVDTRRTTSGVNISKEMIQSLPTARNPWTILNLIPGIMVTKEDVGGNESGDQSMFFGHSSEGAVWAIDGGIIPDPGASGGAPAYLNMNNYEEMQVTLGSNDMDALGGGVQLNFVTKRAGNNYSGDFHLYVEDKAWEMKQDLPEYYRDQGWVTPGIERLYQYGFSFGGPLIKDKLWWYAAYGIQDIHSRTMVGDEDPTWLIEGYLKLTFQSGNTSGDFLLSKNEKKKWDRFALSRAQCDDDSLFDTKGYGWFYQGSIQHLMGNLMLQARVTYFDTGFLIDPIGSDINPDTGHNEGNDFLYFHTSSIGTYYAGSYVHYSSSSTNLTLSLAGNYFAEGILGGDHEIRFGVDYYEADVTSQTLYPNQRIAAFYNRETHSWPEVYLIPDQYSDVSLETISFYLSDTASFGRLTVNMGVRYDKEKGVLNGGIEPAFTWHEPGTIYHGTTPPILAHDLRALDLASKDSGVFWSTISPRLALTYDISGDGKNVFKFSAARYGSPGGTKLVSRFYHLREVDFPWNDINGDEVPNYNEIEWNNSYWNNLMYADADGYGNVTYDPDYNTDILDELTIAFEKEIFEDFVLSITGFYKKRHNLSTTLGMMPDGTIETKDNWYEYDTFTFDNGDTVPVYGQKINPIGSYYTNYSEAYDRYLALQLVLSKKLSNKWMLDASFTYMDWKAHRGASETLNMNNFEFFNDGVVAPRRGVNTRWQAKLSGLMQLPLGLTFTGVFQAREGYVIAYRDYTWVWDSNPHWQRVYHSRNSTNKLGYDRLPVFWMLNLGLEKSFKISDNSIATIFVNGYNVTNNSSTLLVVDDLGAENVGQPLKVLNPGIFQFGFRLNF